MKKIIFIILISIMIAPSVLAQYQLIEPLPIPGLQEGPVTLTSYIGGAIKIAIIIAALLAVVVIVIAGFMYIMAGGNPGKIEKAKDMIWNAIIGLLIALSFYIILYAINPNMLNEIEITPVDVRQAGSTGGSAPVEGIVTPGSVRISNVGIADPAVIQDEEACRNWAQSRCGEGNYVNYEYNTRGSCVAVCAS